MANYLKAIAPTLVPTETVDNEEPAPTSMPTTDKATFMMTMMISMKVLRPIKVLQHQFP